MAGALFQRSRRVGIQISTWIVIAVFLIGAFNVEFDDDGVAGRLIKGLEQNLLERTLPPSFCLGPDHQFHLDSNTNSSIGQKFYAVRNFTASCGIGEDSLKPNEEFRRDTVRLKNILTANYAHSSSCPRMTLDHLSSQYHYGPDYVYEKPPCFGIGTTLGFLSEWFTTFMLNGTVVEIDAYTCDAWFKKDMTRSCDKLFDCYIPSLFLPPGPNEEPENASLPCEPITWFQDRWGWDLLRMASLSWMLAHDPQHSQQQSLAQFIGLDTKPQLQEPCLALHIRRGDACINPDRTCYGYEEYFRAALDLKKLHNLNSAVLMTDAYDFPFELFNASFQVIASDEDKNKYNVARPEKSKSSSYFPENRADELANSTNQVFEDIALGSTCDAFVGTFTASLSKLVYSLIVVRHAYVSPFVSLQGCPGHIQAYGKFEDDDTCMPESRW